MFVVLVMLLCSTVLTIFADSYDDQYRQFDKAVVPLSIFGPDGKIESSKDISPKNACVIENWDQVAQYACRCCIVGKADAIQDDVVDGTALLNSCKDGGSCTDEVIKSLRTSEGLSGVSDTQFVNTLYDRSVIIKEVSVGFDQALASNGIFTENSMKNFLVHAYKSGKIMDSSFSDAQNLEVKNLGTGGGSATLQLFLVKNIKTGNEYIVKEVVKAKAEAFDLSLASHYKPLEKFTTSQGVDNPIVVLPKAYLKYKDKKNTHYLIVMPKAPGVEFLKLMKEYIAQPTEKNKIRLQEAFTFLGKTLGNFHKNFMVNAQGRPDSSSLQMLTLAHGDFHAKNVFYDESNKQIYWIDLEGLGKSVLRPKDVGDDLTHVTLFPFLVSFILSEDKINRKKWAYDFYPAFFNAYLDAFGGNKSANAAIAKKLIAGYARLANWNHEILPYIYEVLDAIASPNLKKSGDTESMTDKKKVVQALDKADAALKAQQEEIGSRGGSSAAGAIVGVSRDIVGGLKDTLKS